MWPESCGRGHVAGVIGPGVIGPGVIGPGSSGRVIIGEASCSRVYGSLIWIFSQVNLVLGTLGHGFIGLQ